MAHPYFKELKEYTLDEILIKVGKDDKDKKRVEALLRNQNFITTKTDPDTGVKRYSFEYVGVIILGDFVFRIIPKYISEDTPDFEQIIDAKFGKILKVIRKVLKKNIPQLDYGTFKETEYNFLQSAISLIEDYYFYGLYSNNIDFIEENGDSEVSWDETIAYVTPVHVNNFHIYDPVLTWDITNDETNLIREIHSVVLAECSDKLKKYGLLEILSVSPVNLTRKKLKELGEPEHIVEILRKELANQYATQKQLIIKMLINYIDNEYLKNVSRKGLSGSFSRSYYGVNLFWPIWEEICKIVLKGDVQRSIEDLPILPKYRKSKYYNINKGLKLIDIIKKPVWVKKCIEENGDFSEISVETDTYKPDAICIYKLDKDFSPDGDNNYSFAILDAKYYVFDIIKYDKSTGKFTGNHPGIEDITKQFMYQQAYKDLIKKLGYKKVHNAFLCPTDEKSCRFGKVQFDLIQSMQNRGNLKDIQVIKINADNIYDWFLANKKEGYDISAYLE